MFLNTMQDCIKSFNSFFSQVLFFNINPFTETNIQFTVALCLVACVYFLFKLRFVCFSYFAHAMKLLCDGGDVSGADGSQKISSFKALFTSIAGAAGLGHIAGVAVAIMIGGPGAVFWIIIASILCMPLRFAEVYLGHKYRIWNGEKFDGGPYWYMKNGLKNWFGGKFKFGKYLGTFYAFLLVISTYGGACSFQTNQAVQVIISSFNLNDSSKYIISAVMCISVFLISVGGIKRVANYCSSAVMIFISLYFLASIIALIYYADQIVNACKIIIHYAFSGSAIFGGGVAVFMSSFKRIVFANETGMGTAPSIHCNSAQTNPVKEALIAMTCPLIDAVFVCVVTGTTIIVSGVYLQKGVEGAVMVQKALGGVHPLMGYIFTAAVPLIALNVMIAWSYYGVRNVEFLFKTTKLSIPYLLTFCCAGFAGGIINDLKIIVEFCDVVCLAIIIPNIVAIILLRKEISSALHEYITDLRYGKSRKG